MKTKITTLKMNIALSNLHYDVLIFTETWLDDSIRDCDILFHGYKSYRCDRNFLHGMKAKGGGVLILIRESLTSSQELLYSDKDQSSIVSIDSQGGIFIVGAVYIAPHTSMPRSQTFLDAYNDFNDRITQLLQNKANKDIFICGDLNLPGFHLIFEDSTPWPLVLTLEEW